MKCLFNISIFFVIAFCLSLSHADPSSDSLLSNSQGSDDPAAAGLQSGRYQTRDPAPGDTPVYSPAPTRFKVKAKKKPASDAPAVAAQVPAAAIVTSATSPAAVGPVGQAPGLTDQVKDIFQGGKDHTGDVYREQIHPDDIRNNKVELEINSGMIYDGATSNYAYRNYYSFAPFVKAQAHLWITPLVGMSASYLSTFSETVPAANSTGSTVNVTSQWTELSADFRKFFGMSRRSNSLNYGLLYTQYNFGIPASATTRASLNSQGLGIYLNARIPVAPSYAWTFGGDFIPAIVHSETQTALNLQSGPSNTASRIGFFVGGEVKLSRENQMTWSIGVKVEKDQFSGSPNLADPFTGLTPSGVNVSNTWSYFNLGYRWGQ